MAHQKNLVDDLNEKTTLGLENLDEQQQLRRRKETPEDCHKENLHSKELDPVLRKDFVQSPRGKDSGEENEEENISNSTWRNVLLSLNEAIDALFGYNLGNVLKIVNFIMMLLIAVNAMMLHSELVKSNHQWTGASFLISGFLLVSFALIFFLNV